MDASILDLRYRTKEILQALDRNEVVNILYHGKLKGRIFPCKRKTENRVEDHPFFGMYTEEKEAVSDTMDSLRSGRYRDL